MRGNGGEPGIVGAELDAVALEPHDELLARPHPHVLSTRGEVGLGRRYEAVALLFERAPAVSIGEDVLERPHRESVLVDLGQDALLELVQLRRRFAEALARRAIRQQAVVQLVRRTNALSLDRLGDTVGAMREHAVHAGREGRVLPVHVLRGRRPSVAYLTGGSR